NAVAVGPSNQTQCHFRSRDGLANKCRGLETASQLARLGKTVPIASIQAYPQTFRCQRGNVGNTIPIAAAGKDDIALERAHSFRRDVLGEMHMGSVSERQISDPPAAEASQIAQI